MKLLKMTLLTAGALICAQSAQAMDVRSLSQKLTKAHTETFGGDDLFKDQIDFSSWNQVINEIKTYVKQNARDDDKLTSEFESLKQQNYKMEYFIKTAYGSLFARKLSGAANSERLEKAANLVAKLSEIRDKSNESGMGSSMGVSLGTSTSRNEVKEILSQLAGLIANTANKAQIHITRKMKI